MGETRLYAWSDLIIQLVEVEACRARAIGLKSNGLLLTESMMGTLLFLAQNIVGCVCAPCALAMERCRSSVLLVHSPWGGAGRVCVLLVHSPWRGAGRVCVLLVHSPWRGAGRVCSLCTRHGEVQVECAPCALAMERCRSSVLLVHSPWRGAGRVCVLLVHSPWRGTRCRSSVLLVHSPWRGAGRVCSLCTRHGEVQVECAPCALAMERCRSSVIDPCALAVHSPWRSAGHVLLVHSPWRGAGRV